MKRAIVLSGGGARGGYQFGAWHALRKMYKRIDIVTGTSIGALNGCLIVQNDYHKARNMWENLNFSNVFDKEIELDYNTTKGKRKLVKTYLEAAILEGGMDVKSLAATIGGAINYKRFYNSRKDFGLITFKLNNLSTLSLTKADIKEEQLLDYLIASATCYPAFKTKKIGDEHYIDGGYGDNLPINLAIKMGATEIIAVDLNVFGMNKKIDNPDVSIRYIKPRNKLGNFLAFDSDLSKRSIRLGYNDTMKEFKRLDGKNYTFKHYHLAFNLWLNSKKIKKQLEQFTNSTLLNVYEKRVMPNNNKEYVDYINDNLEYLGNLFKIDDSYIYGIFDYHNHLLKALDQIEMVTRKSLEEKIKNGEFKELFSRRLLIRYLYDKMFTQDKPRVKQDLAGLAVIFPKEFFGALYLYTIKKH